MLNKIKESKVSSEAGGNVSLFKQTEGNQRSVWIPNRESRQNMDQLLVQIETAVKSVFQNENNATAKSVNDDKQVFIDIANQLIGESTVSKTGRGLNPENDNAKPAQADTKG